MQVNDQHKTAQAEELSSPSGLILLTNEEFGEMLDDVLEMEPLKTWYPTMENAKEIDKDLANEVDFTLWITESNEDRELTEEQQMVHDFLSEMLKRRIRFKDRAKKKKPKKINKSAVSSIKTMESKT